MSRHVITDPATIEMLLLPKVFLLLWPFTLQPHSVASAAEFTGLTPSNMAYWVRRFQKASLLEVAPTPNERRGKHYQAVASGFALLPGNGFTAEEIFTRGYGDSFQNLQRAMIREMEQVAPFWAVTLDSTPSTTVRADVPVEMIQEPAPILNLSSIEQTSIEHLNLWFSMPLSQQAKKEIRADLEALYMKYYEKYGKIDGPVKPDDPRTLICMGMVTLKEL